MKFLQLLNADITLINIIVLNNEFNDNNMK